MSGVDSVFGVAYYSFAHFPRLGNLGGSLKSTHELKRRNGRVPEWLKGTGCKPVSSAYLGSNPSAPTSFARVAQTVEHFVGNEEVTGSSPVAGSICSFSCNGLRLNGKSD